MIDHKKGVVVGVLCAWNKVGIGDGWGRFTPGASPQAFSKKDARLLNNMAPKVPS